jgi:hypothetical protein
MFSWCQGRLVVIFGWGDGREREAGLRGNERSPFDFAQGRLSAALRSGRDDERRSRGLDEVATQEIA